MKKKKNEIFHSHTKLKQQQNLNLPHESIYFFFLPYVCHNSYGKKEKKKNKNDFLLVKKKILV